MPIHVRPSRPGTARLVCLTALAALGALAAGCSSTSSTVEESYCGAVGQRLAELNSPSVSSQADIDRTVALYVAMEAKAPAAVQDEWAKLLVGVRTAATVNPADPTSLQKAADTARATAEAASRIQQYTLQRCGVQLGAPTTAPTTTGASTTTVKRRPATSTTKPKKKTTPTTVKKATPTTKKAVPTTKP